MKRLVLLFTAIFMAAAIGVSAKGGPTIGQRLGEQDTIVIKMANGAKMILQLQNIQQLKAFQNYSLDSLMRELNVYIAQTDSVEMANQGSKNITVTFSKSGNAANPENVSVVVTESNTQTGTANKERHEIKIGRNIKIDVDVEEDGDNTKVNVATPSKAERDSTKAAKAEENYKSTRSGLDIDLGLNNFINTASDQTIPDLKPLGSRYVSLNWHINSQVGGRKSPFHIISGLEFAFNNYMFDDNYIVRDVNNVTEFNRITDISFQKSKLTHSSVNVPLMPMLNFKRDNGKDGFKIGAGGFAGYRLGSHSKLKYNQDGNTEKDKTRDNFNLSDFQYGLTGVIGYGNLDLFMKYNMNDLFKENRGPQANVISFGLRLLN
ncbi:outer membrane beta-barrel protein [Pontibacter harenae]|uniref:outer membrane beta-barrel protein n=1 Tax=Pontibacter harenae TaxID=2894083 RepID=UPI001E64A116|nr:outer membrane beta-barrel protein [Pontibacter harenae]MCC9167052.1 PorT family protein [Pontibacter harenae]